MTIIHTCNAVTKGGVIEYTCPVPGCGYQAVQPLDGSQFHTVKWSTMPDVRHTGSVGGVTMGAEGWEIFWIFWAECDPVTKAILWHNLCQHQDECAACHAIAALPAGAGEGG